MTHLNHKHLVPHIKHHELTTDNTLHVVGVVSNPVRWQSRIRLARAWKERMERCPNVKVYIVEGIYGDRQPEIAESLNHQHHVVRIDSEIWLKENLINIGVRKLLPKNWKYMAWVDMDVNFRDDGWALSTIHQLQHYNLVQPWSDALDLDFHGGILQHFKSFGYLNANNKPMHHGNRHGQQEYSYAHTGYAWACTRYFYENVEKLMDFCLVGAADHIMAWACLGKVRETINPNIGEGYIRMSEDWAKKAMRATSLGTKIGFTHGRIEHSFHGNKKNRKYWDRWKVLYENGFDPSRDCCFDSQGLITICGQNKEKIEHAIMSYNRARNEDDIS